MTRAALIDVLLAAALFIAGAALFGLFRSLPGVCQSAGSVRVEALFAPCLAGGLHEPGRTTEIARHVFPPPPLQPGATLAMEPEQDGPGLDVDVTGSIGKR